MASNHNQGGLRDVGTPNDSKARPVDVSTGWLGSGFDCVCPHSDQMVFLKIDCDIGTDWQGSSDYLMMYNYGKKDSHGYSTFNNIQSGEYCDVDWAGFGGYFFAPGGARNSETPFCSAGGGGGIPGREIVLEIQGGDALFVDKIYFDVWYGQETFCDTHDEFSVGGDNEIAWCLSTDPSDGDNSHAYQSRCANALKINLEDRTVEYLDV